MPKIITLASQKGGVGKSTLALSIYHALIKYSDDIKPVLVELDKQSSLANLKSIQELDFNLVNGFNKKVLEPYDIAILDTPPKLSKEIDKIYKASDLILIPTKTGLFDFVSTVQTVQNIKEVAPKTKAFVVLNMTTANTALNEQVKTELKKSNIKTLKASIGNRLAFHHMQYNTGNIYKESNKKAKEEITALTMEIYRHLI